jgi:hypothetical protein
MDARLSSLPYSAQAAVRDAARVLAIARHTLAANQRSADRAARYAMRAKARVDRLREDGKP